MLVQEGLEVIIEPFNFSFFSISVWGIHLCYCDVEWFVLEMNRDDFVIFEIAPNSFRLLLTVRAIPFLLRDSCLQ